MNKSFVLTIAATALLALSGAAHTDSQGRCAQVTRDAGGHEVWTYVDPGYCY